MFSLRAFLSASLAAAAIGASPVSTAPAEAWGRDGHRIVCDLAYRYLTEAARTEIDRLVALDGEFGHFRDICSWADRVRSTTHASTGPWHYINQERDDPVIDPEDCSGLGCITSAIDLHAGILADTSNSDEERLEALKFLAHWLGDIHQPLHVSINGDRGGNDIPVIWRGERHSNFHRVWDSEILLDHMGEEWPWSAESERWSYLVESLAAEIPLNGVEVYTELNSIAWAQESHDIVRSRDFAYYWARPENTLEFGDAYYERGLRISRQQLKQGGVRLAGLLNRIVADADLASVGTDTGEGAVD